MGLYWPNFSLVLWFSLVLLISHLLLYAGVYCTRDLGTDHN